MGTHDSEHSPPQKYGVNDSNYYQANQQEIIIALNFHVSRWSRANPIQKPETRENLVSRARTGGTGANLKCAKPNKSRTRLFMFCIAPPTLAKVVCVGVCVRIMIFLVRNTLKQNERFKKKRKNGLQRSGTVKRVIWLSICTYLVFACFVFLLRTVFTIVLHAVYQATWPPPPPRFLPSHYEQTMIYDAYEHPFVEIVQYTFSTICLPSDRARAIHFYTHFHSKPMSNQYIYQNEKISRLGDGRSAA